MFLPCLVMAHLPSLLPRFFFLQILLGVHVSVSHGLSLPPVYNSSMCGGVSSISYCFHHSNETDYVDSTSYYCGYTDLNITCIQDGVNHKATIQLPGHEYPMKEIIIYDNETVGLVDSDALRGGKWPRVSYNICFDAEIHSYRVQTEERFERTERSHRVLTEERFERARHRGKKYGCDLCEKSHGWCAYNRNKTFLGCICSDGKMAVDSPNCSRPSCICSDGKMAVDNPNCSRPRDSRHSSLKRKLCIIAGTSSILLICLLAFACLFRLKKYRSKRVSKGTPRIESFLQKNRTLHPKRYTYAEVKKMTKSFAEKLGQGGFGAVYEGNLSDGRQVAVKMIKDSKGDGEEFMNEVASISRTSHVNIVNLLGFCLQGSKRALIYEYMPNGSLERYAFNKNSKGELSLAWEILFDIAIGIARGLEYLHRGCNTRIVHFDIKPHNILLDQDFCPKISDFGMAKLCDNKDSIISLGGARGTVGYIAPEVFSKQFGAISSKSDVYSYGMMVLELVGARERNIDANSESSSHYFPQWIYEHLNEYCISSSEISGETTELVRKMIVVGLWCIQVIPTNRPTMTRVVEMLEGSTIGLELPPKVLLCW